MSVARPLLAAAALCAVVLVAGCPAPAPHPCRIDASKVPPAPAWGTDWQEVMLDEPPNGWIGSFAISPDGTQIVYAHSLGGEFIPTSDGVTMIRIDATTAVDRHPSVLELPGEALRNYASLAWGDAGIAWAHWSAVGTTTPAGKVKVLQKIPKTGKDRPTFPLYSSVGYAPGGDCVAVVLDKADGTRELQAWNAGGAKAPSHVRQVEERETIAAWGADGVLLLKPPPIVSSTSTAIAPSSARWLDPISGKTAAAPAAPPTAEAYGWAPGWVWVGDDGVVHAPSGATIVTLKPRLVPDPKRKEHHRWLRVFPSASGNALAVEEAVIGPGRNHRALHLLLKKPSSG